MPLSRKALSSPRLLERIVLALLLIEEQGVKLQMLEVVKLVLDPPTASPHTDAITKHFC